METETKNEDGEEFHPSAIIKRGGCERAPFCAAVKARLERRPAT
jgi:hypothetical protein